MQEQVTALPYGTDRETLHPWSCQGVGNDVGPGPVACESQVGTDLAERSWEDICGVLLERFGIRRTVVTAGARGAVVLTHADCPGNPTPRPASSASRRSPSAPSTPPAAGTPSPGRYSRALPTAAPSSTPRTRQQRSPPTPPPAAEPRTPTRPGPNCKPYSTRSTMTMPPPRHTDLADAPPRNKGYMPPSCGVRGVGERFQSRQAAIHRGPRTHEGTGTSPAPFRLDRRKR